MGPMPCIQDREPAAAPQNLLELRACQMESVFKGATIEAPLSTRSKSKRGKKIPLLPYEEFELKARNAALAEHEKLKAREARKQRLYFLAGLWPFWVGCIMAAMAPEVKEFFAPFNPWVMRVIFPLVAIGARPEIKLASSISGFLPMLLLVGQFPLEGLLARALVRGRTAFWPVMVQIAFIHALGIAFVVLIYGGLTRLGSL